MSQSGKSQSGMSQISTVPKSSDFLKPIPALVTAPLADDTGFTPNEKLALQKGFRMIMAKGFKRHAYAIHVEFFNNNEQHLSFFRKRGKLNTEQLNKHALKVLNMFNEIIEQALSSKAVLHSTLAGMEMAHTANGVRRSDAVLMAGIIKTYILDVLHPIRSPTLEKALEKLTKVFEYSLFAEIGIRTIRKSVDIY